MHLFFQLQGTSHAFVKRNNVRLENLLQHWNYGQKIMLFKTHYDTAYINLFKPFYLIIFILFIIPSRSRISHLYRYVLLASEMLPPLGLCLVPTAFGKKNVFTLPYIQKHKYFITLVHSVNHPLSRLYEKPRGTEELF